MTLVGSTHLFVLQNTLSYWFSSLKLLKYSSRFAKSIKIFTRNFLKMLIRSSFVIKAISSSLRSNFVKGSFKLFKIFKELETAFVTKLDLLKYFKKSF